MSDIFEEITTQKAELPVIRKMPKTDHGGSNLHHRDLIHDLTVSD